MCEYTSKWNIILCKWQEDRHKTDFCIVGYQATFLSKSNIWEVILLRCEVLAIVKCTINSSITVILLYEVFSNTDEFEVSLQKMYF